MNNSLLNLIHNCKAINIPCLTVFKTNESLIEMPISDHPYIFIVAEGSVRLHTPNGIMDYVSGQYSVSAIDTPTKAEVVAFSEDKTFTAISVEFSFEEVISVILSLDNDLLELILSSDLSDEVMDSADKSVVDTVGRLLLLNDRKEQLAFMQGHLKKEIIFHILTGNCGRHFIQSVTSLKDAGEIYEINSWIKENYKTPFTVEQLADKTNMSISNFHQKFKSAVGMGPLQCQKRLRLTEARRLMLDENIGVTDAAMDVGYESVSQFIRDYKKMFSASPKEDTEALKKQLSK